MCEDIFVYLFGYGSLMWRPGFSYTKKFNAYIKGWKRVFYQGSTDHRGTPEAPGRVVTLIKQPEETKDTEEWITWGTVYAISDDEALATLKNLDYREKGGYERHELDIYLDEQSMVSYGKAIVYLATTENEEYLGEDTIDNIAQHIFRSIGPSGRNIDYLLKLANSLHEMGVVDQHVFDIEKIVLELMDRHQINHHNSLVENLSLSSSPTSSMLSSINSLVVNGATTTGTSGSSPGTNSPLLDEKALELLHRHKRFYMKPQGTVIIDQGAVQAISQRAKSLLPVGIIGFTGEFESDALVTIQDSNGSDISRGLTNYSSKELALIIGKQSKDLESLLGYFKGESVVDHTNLILL
ncbi:hypothetical protein CYY_001391 [Polysphondylium violaceum]|uniref:glutathione-specific gamma-glutamylcyclotransferase n=1 Tax=Polysphondylium violaceum TaxID=133409 RepID=A0A8J4V1P5_9MYCE|nr:hypothetical protein CYY_001391 [Polysphondylium violaceum]